MPQSPLAAKNFIITLLAGWLVLTVLQAVLLSSLSFSIFTSVLDSIISNTLLLLGAFLIINITRYYLPASYQYVGVIVTCLMLSAFWLFVSNSFLKIIVSENTAYDTFLQNSLMIRYAYGFLVFIIVTIGAILWYNWLEQHKAEQRKIDTEKLSRDAELFNLRQQLQPHFLFNSLNSINALIGQNPQQARKMVHQLSSFLRGTLKKEESQLVTLKEELNHLNLYLEIEKVRFGNRLQTHIENDEVCDAMLIPTLLLQPIVENAIKFGLYDTTGETLISIECEVMDNELYVHVTNPFDPETAAPNKGTGFGLSSIARRLYLLYARNDLLITSVNESLYTTTVKIPQQKL